MFLFIADIDQFMFKSFWDRYHSNLFCWAVASVQCFLCSNNLIWLKVHFYLDSDWHVHFDILLNSVKSSLCFVSQVVDTLLHWYVSYTYLWLVADVYTKVYVMCLSKGHAFNVKLWYWSCQLGISIFSVFAINWQSQIINRRHLL